MPDTTMSAAEVVPELIRRTCARNFAGALELCHEDMVLSLPTMLPEPVVVEGRAEQTALNNSTSGPTADGKPPRQYDHLEARDIRVHQSTDPNMVIVEWTFVSHVGGREVVHNNIQVTECRDGQMVHTIDYHNFVARAVANGNVPEHLDLIEKMILPEDRPGSPSGRSPNPSTRSGSPASGSSSPSSPAEVVLAEIGRTSTGDIAGALELCADDIVLTLPFMLPEPVVIEGKAALVAQLEATGRLDGAKPSRLYDDLEVRDVRVHETTDPNVVVVEWKYVSRIGDSLVVNPNIRVSEIRDGKIVRTTDYHNHVTRAVADGDVPACLEIIEKMILPEDRT